MILDEMDRLESRWKGPEARKKGTDEADEVAQIEAIIDWQLIDGLTPYRGKWTAVVDGPDLSGE
ncbi:hypothetical protein K6Y78_40300, partial [Burkholderia cenocepacia]|uniref:hypothetical protein n=1 Tax=Burkholderia cenocepacia TaxID=95486 RepID=UPI00222EB7E8